MRINLDQSFEEAADKFARKNDLPVEKAKQAIKDDLEEAWEELEGMTIEIESPSSPQEQLERYDSTGAIERVAILTQRDPDVCHPCRPLDGEKYSIEEALEKQPLPHDGCENDSCRCTYRPLA